MNTLVVGPMRRARLAVVCAGRRHRFARPFIGGADDPGSKVGDLAVNSAGGNSLRPGNLSRSVMTWGWPRIAEVSGSKIYSARMSECCQPTTASARE